jgi:hypothetical protein
LHRAACASPRRAPSLLVYRLWAVRTALAVAGACGVVSGGGMWIRAWPLRVPRLGQLTLGGWERPLWTLPGRPPAA